MRKIISSIPSAANGTISIVLNYDNGTKRVVKYARFLVENKIGRELTMYDIVLHKDGNTMNFALDNLELTTKLESIRSHKPDLSVNTLEARISSLLARAEKKRKNPSVKQIKNQSRIEVAPKGRSGMVAYICGQCNVPNQKLKRNLIVRERLGKPAFCSISCAAKYNFAHSPKVQETLRRAREKDSLLKEAKRVAAKLAALTSA